MYLQQTGFCNHCRDFKHIRLLRCTTCEYTTCASPGDGSAVGCVLVEDVNARFICPTCYLKMKRVPPVRISSVSRHPLLLLLMNHKTVQGSLMGAEGNISEGFTANVAAWAYTRYQSSHGGFVEYDEGSDGGRVSMVAYCGACAHSYTWRYS